MKKAILTLMMYQVVLLPVYLAYVMAWLLDRLDRLCHFLAR